MQRGTNRQTVFHGRSNCEVYFELSTDCCLETGVSTLIFSCCWITSPWWRYRRKNSLWRWFCWRCRHVSQNRFQVCLLERAHLWNALRYVGRNPVRARLSNGPREVEWSSAASHLTGEDPSRMLGFSRDLAALSFGRVCLVRMKAQRMRAKHWDQRGFGKEGALCGRIGWGAIRVWPVPSKVRFLRKRAVTGQDVPLCPL